MDFGNDEMASGAGLLKSLRHDSSILLLLEKLTSAILELEINNYIHNSGKHRCKFKHTKFMIEFLCILVLLV